MWKNLFKTSPDTLPLLATPTQPTNSISSPQKQRRKFVLNNYWEFSFLNFCHFLCEIWNFSFSCTFKLSFEYFLRVFFSLQNASNIDCFSVAWNKIPNSHVSCRAPSAPLQNHTWDECTIEKKKQINYMTILTWGGRETNRN